MTNAHEGVILVNPNVSSLGTTEDYIRQIAPRFNSSQIETVASLYGDIGLETVTDTAMQLFGESERTVTFPTSLTLLTL